ncbi:amino acid ABC transporter ATP-binding protein [Orbaceae bacterium ESL0721]|nr:amino acid ABC transporter ATP-binding protein [Orbaceae bacterium ESL0721]
MTKSMMINVQQLVKKFGNQIVLNGIDLQVNRGEVLAIIGPSGSGKSTLLRCLNLLEKPQEGILTIGDVTLNLRRYRKQEEKRLRHQSAMVFQQYNLFKNRTALQNITIPLILVKKMGKNSAKQAALQLLEQVGLLLQADQYPITLSGGQQQRVAIARALAMQPNVILFDEPTSALDPEKVYEVLHVIRQLAQQKTTMVIVTHEIEFAKQVANRIIFMAEGRIIEQGEAKTLINSPKMPQTQRFLRQLTDSIEYEI